jgi:transcriptional regulator with XRE-family HTH domain
MGLKKRVIPKRLPEKIKFIRSHFDLTLEEMVVKIEKRLSKLGFPDIKVYTGNITEFEKGKREPQLPVLLAYAHLANVFVDVLINDELALPNTLPCKIKSVGTKQNED